MILVVRSLADLVLRYMLTLVVPNILYTTPLSFFNILALFLFKQMIILKK